MGDRDIPEETVEKAIERVAHEVYEAWHVTANRDAYVGDAIRAAASQAVSAALAGRQVVDLPEPDARRDVNGLVDVEWHDPRHGRHWLVIATRHADGGTEVSNGGVVIDPDHAEARGLMLLAAAREARRLAAGSGSGED